MLSRRQLLGGGMAAAAAGLAYPVAFEPRWFDLTHTAIGSAPPGGATARLLQLSDLHSSWAVPLSSIAYAIQLGLAERPDIICLTGDFITHRYPFDTCSYIVELKRLSAAAPTFATFGNHDGGRWAAARRGYSDHKVVERMLEDAGVHVLHNRSVSLSVRGGRLVLAGVGDLWADELDADSAFREVGRGARTVLLSHNPDSKQRLKRYPWDLMLCGHTHGGQVIIPFEGPKYAPVEDLRFVAGLHSWDGRLIYTTRGVGNLGGVRFRCRPEITMLDIALT